MRTYGMVQKPDHLTQGLASQWYIVVFIEYTTESAYCAAFVCCVNCGRTSAQKKVYRPRTVSKVFDS